MSKKQGRGNKLSQPESDGLFQRVAAILDQARSNVVRAVNSNMVLAYWLIGREIVQEMQGGEDRAEYGKQVIENLSARLTARYGRGFSSQTLWNYRLFHQIYADRFPILSPAGRELAEGEKLFPTGRESASHAIRHPSGDELALTTTVTSLGSNSSNGFSPQLTWSHYRALMRVADDQARAFYEREAAESGWSKIQLERQIQSSYYQRILANRGQAGLVATDRERLPGESTQAESILKSPYVLEFLGLPDSPVLHEDALEQAKVPGDNPTIGLILCSDKSEAVAKYSVLSEGRQIFASKYLQFLPSEQELMLEIERERRLIEGAMEEARNEPESE